MTNSSRNSRRNSRESTRTGKKNPDVLNWRTADFRQLKEAEAGKFLRTHPNLVVETPLVDPGNFYPYRKPGDIPCNWVAVTL